MDESGILGTFMMNSKKGFTLVEILIVVAIIALLSAIAIPNLLRVRVHANDAATIKVLKALASASDMYATSGFGNYPSDMTSLVGVSPPYIASDYCGTTAVGFTFSCNNSFGGYVYTATPLRVGGTGTTTYTITTGGVLSP